MYVVHNQVVFFYLTLNQLLFHPVIAHSNPRLSVQRASPFLPPSHSVETPLMRPSREMGVWGPEIPLLCLLLNDQREGDWKKSLILERQYLPCTPTPVPAQDPFCLCGSLPSKAPLWAFTPKAFAISLEECPFCSSPDLPSLHVNPLWFLREKRVTWTPFRVTSSVIFHLSIVMQF